MELSTGYATMDFLAGGKAYKIVHRNTLKTHGLLKRKTNAFFCPFGYG